MEVTLNLGIFSLVIQTSEICWVMYCRGSHMVLLEVKFFLLRHNPLPS